MKTEILSPDPARMIEGLRDTGYEFNTAIADVIDNSIAADATNVSLRIAMDFEGNIRVVIADNGIGMNRAALMNAMKYGSDRRSDAAKLLRKEGLSVLTVWECEVRRPASVLRRLERELIRRRHTAKEKDSRL